MRLVNRWDERADTGETNELLLRLARLHASYVSDARVRERLPSITGDSVSDLCNLSVPYALADSLVDSEPHESWKVVPSRARLAEDLYHFGQIAAFFKKRADIDLGIDRKQVALDTFRKSEVVCRETNDIFRKLTQGGIQLPPDVDSVLHTAARKISAVLGRCPKLSDLEGYFGPGATTQLPKRNASTAAKLSQTIACSGDMTPILDSALESLPHVLEQFDTFEDNDSDVYDFGPRSKWDEYLHDTEEEEKFLDERRYDKYRTRPVIATVEVHPGKLVTVPKNCKTDRTVMIEPWLNGFYQLGVGRVIAERLRSVGVDVKNQDKNKNLARTASFTGELATLDLSSASDSIAVKLVEHLLPADWYDLLSYLRTSVCEVGDERITLEKFSSMGNGYTFPLESLIFWALSSSVSGCHNRTAVYGDDIIVPTKSVGKVVKVLNVCGFSVNLEKSFYSGYFRESCGGDYYSGFDIRPCFIKDRMTGQDLFRLHNFYVNRGYPELAEVVREYISPDLILWGPKGYGDGHLVDDGFPGYRKTKHVKRGWGGRLFDTYRWNPRKFKRKLPGDRILPVYSTYVNSVGTDEGLTLFLGTLSYYQRKLAEDIMAVGYDPRDFDLSGAIHCTETKFTPHHNKAGKPDSGKEGHEGIPEKQLPGVRGYSRISIYTLG